MMQEQGPKAVRGATKSPPSSPKRPSKRPIEIPSIQLSPRDKKILEFRVYTQRHKMGRFQSLRDHTLIKLSYTNAAAMLSDETRQFMEQRKEQLQEKAEERRKLEQAEESKKIIDSIRAEKRRIEEKRRAQEKELKDLDARAEQLKRALLKRQEREAAAKASAEAIKRICGSGDNGKKRKADELEVGSAYWTRLAKSNRLVRTSM